MKFLSEASASIVLFKSNPNEINQLLEQLQPLNVYLIDNSPTDSLRTLAQNSNIKYFHFPNNPGFGIGHNIAIAFSKIEGSKFHFLINPDIIFEKSILSEMVKKMAENPAIGMLMPQILNLDGSIQTLPKLIPSPFSIIIRKLKNPKFLLKNYIKTYELRFAPPDKIYNTPIISGCFCLINISAFKEVGFFDNRYFMYFEDWDLSRKINSKFQTLFYPKVSVYHGYKSGANKSIKLFIIFIISALKYFNKWGWFNDVERKKVNRTTLLQFKN